MQVRAKRCYWGMPLFVAPGAVACSGEPRHGVPRSEQESRAAEQPTARGAVLTQHNDNGRTGATLAETTLNTSNVNVKRFGKRVFNQRVFLAWATNDGALRVARYNSGRDQRLRIVVALLRATRRPALAAPAIQKSRS